MRQIFALILAFMLALGLSLPIAAQTGANQSMTTSIRDMADGLSGIKVNGGQTADKLVFLGRNTKGELVILGIAALAPGSNEGIEPVAGSIAIMRTRASTSNGNVSPEAADFELAKSTGIPLFIIGEWRDPPQLWEVGSDGGTVKMREIDPGGRPGEWRTEGS